MPSKGKTPSSKASAPAKKSSPKAAPSAAPEAKSPDGKEPSGKASGTKRAAAAAPAEAPVKSPVRSRAVPNGKSRERGPALTDEQLTQFARKQKQRLLELKDAIMDSMTGMHNDTLRSRAEGSEASAFGMHQADAGTDAYDRDFALNLLAQEQDALYEIEEALKRVDAGTYGTCEMSGKKIPQARLEALPFARFTIECQQQVERELGPGNSRRSVRSLFGLMGSEDDDEDGDEESVDNDKG